MVGAVTSRTVMLCATVPLVLPQPSFAFHVLVNVLVQVLPELTVPTTEGVTAPWQASFAVGATQPRALASVVPGQPDTEKSAPAAPIVGAVTSLTVMFCATVPLVLPQPSFAFHVLVNTLEQLLPELTVPTTEGVTAP